ncbi:MAG: response regulator [Limisphaerales bacterium]
MKILVADDDATSLMVLTMTLTKLGHAAVPASDGEQAWHQWQADCYPVLISDWVMPVLDGLALCRRIRKTRRDHYTSIILLTSLGGRANYLEAMNAGADDFVTKPFDEEQLSARLAVAERVLGLRQHVRQLEELLPICAYCKQIRDEQDSWHSVESYIAERSEANTKFSHGICPGCLKKVEAEIAGLEVQMQAARA